jgi:hypothetical protein
MRNGHGRIRRRGVHSGAAAGAHAKNACVAAGGDRDQFTDQCASSASGHANSAKGPEEITWQEPRVGDAKDYSSNTCPGPHIAESRSKCGVVFAALGLAGVQVGVIRVKPFN